MQRGYHRKHITGDIRDTKPKKLSKADQVLWDEWIALFKSGKTKRPFKFWKTDKKNEGNMGGKMNELIEKYLGEKYSDKKLPKEAKMIATKAGMEAQAYIVHKDGTISVWEKNKKKGWREWWHMDKQQFKAEFGIKV